MRKFEMSLALALASLVSGRLCLAWTTVGTGIEYQEFYLSDPNIAYVARMDRTNTQTAFDTMLAYGRLGSSEIITSQASRQEDAINYWDQDWGERNDIIVAINGDFLDEATNTPAKGQVTTGWYTKAIDASGRRFQYRMDRNLALSIASLAYQRVEFLDAGGSITIDDINVTRDSDDLIVYTPQYYSTTRTDSSGVEVLVEMTRPATPQNGEAPMGYIRQIRQNAGSTQIPFDCVVLSATGSRATSLLAKAQVGGRVGIAFNLSSSPLTFDHTYASLGGGEVFLGDGVVWGGQDIRHPRTAIAYNDKYLYFVVVDGRSTISAGMTMTELGNFCKNYLDATWGINQDGGGSSTMVVNGVVKNDPSDGYQRAVVNGAFMAVVQPKLQSTTFSSGDIVRTNTSNCSLRLGPGTNYTSIATIGNNTQGTILDHHLRGVYAKGYYWWKCNFNGTTGWMSQSLLTLVSTSNLPRFMSHPAKRSPCPGTSATFSVIASGTAPLSYQWQFNGANLSNDSTYSGVTTASLVVSNVSNSMEGSYRCVVTGPYGSTTSYSAPLRMLDPTTIIVQPQFAEAPYAARGSTVSFSCDAKGDTTVTYRWQRDGVNLSDSSKFTGTSTQTFTLVSVNAFDEGSYRCVATSTCGPINSNAIDFRVFSADFDRDGDVDQDDFGHLQHCLTGPTVAITDPACLDANLDADPDHDVDAADVNAFIQCITGPGGTRATGC